MVGVLREWVSSLAVKESEVAVLGFCSGCSVLGFEGLFRKLRDPNLEITPQTPPAGIFGLGCSSPKLVKGPRFCVCGSSWPL